jgi:hypothetical protein
MFSSRVNNEKYKNIDNRLNIKTEKRIFESMSPFTTYFIQSMPWEKIGVDKCDMLSRSHKIELSYPFTNVIHF